MKRKASHNPTDHPEKKKPVKILATDKGTQTRNPLLGSLSDSPEKENKAVRHSEKNKSKN
jgi:hypothetical protein